MLDHIKFPYALLCLVIIINVSSFTPSLIIGIQLLINIMFAYSLVHWLPNDRHFHLVECAEAYFEDIFVVYINIFFSLLIHEWH